MAKCDNCGLDGVHLIDLECFAAYRKQVARLERERDQAKLDHDSDMNDLASVLAKFNLYDAELNPLDIVERACYRAEAAEAKCERYEKERKAWAYPALAEDGGGE